MLLTMFKQHFKWAIKRESRKNEHICHSSTPYSYKNSSNYSFLLLKNTKTIITHSFQCNLHGASPPVLSVLILLIQSWDLDFCLHSTCLQSCDNVLVLFVDQSWLRWPAIWSTTMWVRFIAQDYIFIQANSHPIPVTDAILSNWG